MNADHAGTIGRYLPHPELFTRAHDRRGSREHLISSVTGGPIDFAMLEETDARRMRGAAMRRVLFVTDRKPKTAGLPPQRIPQLRDRAMNLMRLADAGVKVNVCFPVDVTERSELPAVRQGSFLVNRRTQVEAGLTQ